MASTFVAFASPLVSPSFVSPTASVLHLRPPTSRRFSIARPTHPARVTPIACTPPPTDDSSSSAPPSSSEPSPKSKTEEIASLIGQSKETMKASADNVFEQEQLSNRRKYSLAAGSVIVAVAAFLIQKSTTSDGATLLKYLTSNSAGIEVIGNGRPTVVEVGASWCENCKFMAKRMFNLENDFVGQVNFVVLDADDPKNEQFVSELGVDGIPQFTLLDSTGKAKANLVGIVPEAVLNQDIKAMLSGKDSLPFPGFDFNQPIAPLF